MKEFLDICDEYGNPTGETVERSQAHRQDVCHRTAHVWVIRHRGGRLQILLQRRCHEKESFPDCFDTSSAGHIQAGDEPLESAIRELKEELGLTASPEELKFAGTFRNHYEREFYGKPFRDNEVTFVYVLERDVEKADLRLQAEEVSDAAWFDFEEVYREKQNGNPLYCVSISGMDVLKVYSEKEHSTGRCRKRELFDQQKELLDTFLRTGAISAAQYNKSLEGLRQKMSIE